MPDLSTTEDDLYLQQESEILKSNDFYAITRTRSCGYNALAYVMTHLNDVKDIEFCQWFFAKYYKKANTDVLFELRLHELRDFIIQLLLIPEAMKAFKPWFFTMTSAQFQSYGDSEETYGEFTRAIIFRSENFVKSLLSRPALEITNDEFIKLEDFIQEKEREGWRFLRLQGRTILLTNDCDDILAIKVQKDGESVGDLRREFSSAKFFSDNKINFGLLSQFPEPQGLYQIPRVDEWLRQFVDAESHTKFINLLKQLPYHFVYVYRVKAQNQNYFTYLHDPGIADTNFALANYVAVNDLFRLLFRGFVFDRLADLFHTHSPNPINPDHGRFNVLYQLLTQRSISTGSMTEWYKGIEYLNIRLSGLADLGDWSALEDYLHEDFTPCRDYFSISFENYGINAGSYIIANFMAEYLFILHLAAGRRGAELTAKAREQNQSKEHIDKLWLQLAEQLLKNSILAIHIMTEVPLFLLQKIFSQWISEVHLARQMQYWMTNDCLSDLQKREEGTHRLPVEIYGEEATVEFVLDKKNSRQAEYVAGDIGFKHGRYPITEAVRLFYFTVSLIILFREENPQKRQNLLFSLLAVEKNNKFPVEISHLQSALQVANRRDNACHNKLFPETGLLSGSVSFFKKHKRKNISGKNDNKPLPAPAMWKP